MHKHRMFFPPLHVTANKCLVQKNRSNLKCQGVLLKLRCFSQSSVQNTLCCHLWKRCDTFLKLEWKSPGCILDFRFYPSVDVVDLDNSSDFCRGYLVPLNQIVACPFQQCVPVRSTSLKTMWPLLELSFQEATNEWFYSFVPRRTSGKNVSLHTILTKKKEKEKTNLSGHASIHLHQGSVHMI